MQPTQVSYRHHWPRPCTPRRACWCLPAGPKGGGMRERVVVALGLPWRCCPLAGSAAKRSASRTSRRATGTSGQFGWVADAARTRWTGPGRRDERMGADRRRRAPVDRGWSTHAVEGFARTSRTAGCPPGTPSPRSTRLGRNGGHEEDRDQGRPPRHPAAPGSTGWYLDYRGEGVLSDGAGAFKNATGHFVTRGRSYLEFINMPDGTPVPAGVLGWGRAITSSRRAGMICGGRSAALGLR